MARTTSYPEYLTDLADAIRDKTEYEDQLLASAYDDFIRAIKGNDYKAGENIQISDDYVISATDTTYTAGTNVAISSDNVISAKDTTYLAGDNINISSDNIISTPSYKAGDNITISEDKTISAKDTTYLAGKNIEITDKGVINNLINVGYGLNFADSIISLASTFKVNSTLLVTGVDLTNYEAGIYYSNTSDEISFKVKFKGMTETVSGDLSTAQGNRYVLIKKPSEIEDKEPFIIFFTDNTTARDNRYINLMYRNGNSISTMSILHSSITSYDADFKAIPKTEIAPTANTHLTNKKYVDEQISILKEAIGKITQIKFEVVDTLPETGVLGTIYLVKNTKTETQNIYDEYIYVNNSWEKIGTTAPDLSNYVTKDQHTSDLNTLESNIDTKLDKKQDKLTAGTNISISDDYVISATDTTYKAGTNISISNDNTISATDTKYTAGDHISIDSDNKISAYGFDYQAGANIVISSDRTISGPVYKAGNNITIDNDLVISAESNNDVDILNIVEIDVDELVPNNIYYIRSGAADITFTHTNSIGEIKAVIISLDNLKKSIRIKTPLKSIKNIEDDETLLIPYEILNEEDINNVDTKVKGNLVITKDSISNDTGISETITTVETEQTITGAKTFTTIPKISSTPTNSLEATNKEYVDSLIRQVSTMPEATESIVGNIYQYNGETTDTYTNGYFYKCTKVVDSQTSVISYTWEQVNVQAEAIGNTFVVSGGTNISFDKATYPKKYQAMVDGINYYLKTRQVPIIRFNQYGDDSLYTITSSYITLGASSEGRQRIDVIFTGNEGTYSTIYGVTYQRIDQYTFITWVDETEYNNKKITEIYSLNTGSNQSFTASANPNQGVGHTILGTSQDLPLGTNNKTAYTPSSDYHPSTKKYVDDLIAKIPTSMYTGTITTGNTTFLSNMDDGIWFMQPSATFMVDPDGGYMTTDQYTNAIIFIQQSEGLKTYFVFTKQMTLKIDVSKAATNYSSQYGYMIVGFYGLQYKIYDLSSLANKQDKLTAGDNVVISNTNVISATDTKYTAGDNITISDTNVISASNSCDVSVYNLGSTIYDTSSPKIKLSDDTVYNNLISFINDYLKNGTNKRYLLQKTGYISQIYPYTSSEEDTYKRLEIYIKPESDVNASSGYCGYYYTYFEEVDFIVYVPREEYETGTITQVGSDSSYTRGNIMYSSYSPRNYIQEPSNLVKTNNSVAYTPTGDYNPATKLYVDTKISALTTISFKVVDTLPETGESNIIYLVPSTKTATQNIYEEYIWISDKSEYELLGTTSLDIEPATDEDIENIFTTTDTTEESSSTDSTEEV